MGGLLDGLSLTGMWLGEYIEAFEAEKWVANPAAGQNCLSSSSLAWVDGSFLVLAHNQPSANRFYTDGLVVSSPA